MFRSEFRSIDSLRVSDLNRTEPYQPSLSPFRSPKARWVFAPKNILFFVSDEGQEQIGEDMEKLLTFYDVRMSNN